MNYATINKLFELFSGEPAECYQSFIVDAVRTVSHMKKQEAEWEIRLDFLAASIASCDLEKMQAQIKKEDVPISTKFAESLVSAYKASCSDLLVEENENG